ncbi:GNAT family N-acetyltransferase [[Clostridium] aminophilum]|uniref:Protein N-acetyltransferase, RimJ/RimL family n=1 Tax=[Clostridium] aminophilum TaxID=1526 RepID=A0A1I6JAN9_9FIRM|nr:GNAT family protein [[Clostridium] aminophilum]SFR76004.1 Protein N-acetyltransferase, RimJ/RimL family [[Clostridium] aminophilum]
MRIRDYRREDSAEICRWVRTKDEMYRWTAEVFDHLPIGAYELDSHYAPQIQEGRFFPLSVENESGELVGHFTVRYPDQADDSNVRIGYVILRPDFRGQGLGKKMIQLALEYARKLSARRAELLVFANNPDAVHCYEAVGFTPVKTIDYEIPSGVWKCIEMEYYL